MSDLLQTLRMKVFSDTPTRLSVSDFKTASDLLKENDRAGMYLFLAEKTGNPGYVNTAQISSGSACLIGGPAISINAYLQKNYSDTYPKFSIEEFSTVVAGFELRSFLRNGIKTDPITGEQYYEGPSELQSYEVAREAWRNANPGKPELVNLFPGNVLLWAHYQAAGNAPLASNYINDANSFLFNALGSASAQEYLNVGTQYGKTLTQSYYRSKAEGGRIEQRAIPGLNSTATVFLDSQGKVYSVFTLKDIAACGFEFFSPGIGVPSSPIQKITFDQGDQTGMQSALLVGKVETLFPEIDFGGVDSQRSMAGLASALTLYSGNADAYRNESGDLVISGGGRQTVVNMADGTWDSVLVKNEGTLYFQDSSGAAAKAVLPRTSGEAQVSTGTIDDPQFQAGSSSLANGLRNLINYRDHQVAAVLGDINSLVSAIKSGEPLPVLSSGLNLLNDFANPLAHDGIHLRDIANHELNAAATVVGGLNSLYSLQNAFKHGDTLDKITATASTVNFVNSTLYKSIKNVSSGAFHGGLDTLLNGTKTASGFGLINGGTPGVLPILGLINGIRSGDPIGITQGLIGVINPGMLAGPVGWALMAFQIIKSLTDEPPEAWGTAKVVFDDAYGTRLDVVGEAFGMDRVSDKQNAVLDYMRLLIEQTTAANPNDPLGVIPQRMPTLSWRERRQSDPGYSILDIDPLTGAQRYPYLRYDDDGVPFSADPSMFQVDPTDPGQRLPFMQALVTSAIGRGALAPMWEVKTAKMQQDAGDPNAGLTEEERAAKAGLSGQVDPTTNERDPGQFRPIILDMNGDGQINTVGKDASGVTFDWDASGFQKKTAWAGAGEGFLFLDRNPNGMVDSGKELFSNSAIADAAKGARSMAWVDGNADGRINELDPVFEELRVWRDDGDGVLEDGESKRISALGITQIDYQMGRFMRDGQYYALGSPELEAEEEGSKINVTDAGIRVEFSNGELSLYITRVLTDIGANVNSDTFDMYEDADPVARTTPGTAIIAAALLLANDEFNGVSAGLTITGVGNAANGTVTLGSDPTVGPAIFFQPNANYNGPASFEYTVTAPDGSIHSANVSVNILPVNDFPVATDYRDASRPIYDYRDVTFWVESLGESGEIFHFDFVGTPIYEPYIEVISTPIYEEYGESGPVLVGHTTSYVHHTSPITTEAANSGHVQASDPDGGLQVRYEIVSNPVYGKVELDPITGAYSYVGLRPAGVLAPDGSYRDPVTGAAVNGNTYSNLYGGQEEKFTDVFTVRVLDLQDPNGDTFIDRDIAVTHYGPRPMPEVQTGGKSPIAIDLNGDGFHFIGVDDSNVFFDVNGDGWRRKIAWNNPEDGFIAFDKNADGKIDSFDELSFVPYKPDGQTDLEGLRAFDTNNDGVFSAGDAEWEKFGVWQDANSDGITDPGEFRGLEALGIQSISLSSDGKFQAINGQTVHGVAAATKTDGSQLAIADVTLEYQNVTQVRQPDGTLTEEPVSRRSEGEIFEGTVGNDLVFGTRGSDRFTMGEGDDTVMDDAGNDVVEAGFGNDLVYTGNDNDFVDGGTGDDTVFAGNGNDILFGGDGNDLLMAEGGNDVAFGGAGNDFLSGGYGNDALSGGVGEDVLSGEEGWDALFGEQGNDELYGHAGNDALYGGSGNDLLDGGEGADTMEGDDGDDTYVVDTVEDQVIEGESAGVDTVLSSVDYTLAAHFENLTLTGVEDLDGTGNEHDNVLVGNSGSNALVGGAGSDVLDGGRGLDALAGGLGDDTYIVDNVDDTVVENAGEGADTVRSRVGYTLGEHVENLTLIGIDAIGGNGNAQDNIIVGNAASNRIDGGAGADEMRGGRGNDNYVVDHVDDLVIEGIGEGLDSVESGIDYVLTANVENLVLAGHAIAGTGNELDNVLLGNGENNLFDGGFGADLMAGGFGSDVYHVDNLNDVIIESESAGTDTVVAKVSYSLATNVENLMLSGGALNATGNELDNTLTGNAVANVMDGGAGADALIGGDGNDLYVVDNANDAIVEQFGEGVDHVQASANYTLAANVENLTLTGMTVLAGSGNDLSNVLTANDAGSTLSGLVGNDILIGGTGNDRLDGGTGADQIAGGEGDDTYVVDNATDSVFEMENEGIDSVLSSIDYALTANVENLVLTSAAIRATGNELGNVLTGNAADNVLDGGAGADAMDGGAGNDVYFVDDAGDSIIEQAGNGIDHVQASVGHALDANVENLTLIGADAVAGFGNELDNVLKANDAGNTLSSLDGNDVLIGGIGDDILDGGAGADQMSGGSGNDTFVIDDAGDIVIENIGEGVDTVKASVSYVLNANVDNLMLVGAAALSATGNDLANTLTANEGDSALFGMAGSDTLLGGNGSDHLDGGYGADRMQGGGGNDTYVVDDVEDLVLEMAGEGIDLVISSVDYMLTANVDNLQLMDRAIQATGNELDNGLIGNALDNVLDGGAGADVMTGGAGSDFYVVDNADDTIVEQADEGIDRVQASVSYALAANVEHLMLIGSVVLAGSGNELNNVLTANDAGNTLSGLEGNDILFGGVGNDHLDGGAGADDMAGGAGSDRYAVDHVGDRVMEALDEGGDSVVASVDYTLTANVEDLRLTGAAIVGVGNALDNVITGNAENNVLDGGAGADEMAGEDGDDTYVVDSSGDVAIENAEEGMDTVRASVNFVLSVHIEQLVLTGYADLVGTGNALDNVLVANNGDTVLFGVAGNDLLIGGEGNDYLDGGSGGDRMQAGGGSDTYVVDNAEDLILEAAGEGNDSVISTIDYTLTANVENLALMGDAHLGSGNDLDNILVGNAWDNVLDGAAGKDRMIGGAGDDVYIIDDAGDIVIENIGEGVDTVKASVSYVLNANVDNLMLVGAAALSATGNDLANTLTANEGDSALFGMAGSDTLLGGNGSNYLDGGYGADRMQGGGGNDTYVVDDAEDLVIEAAGAGMDAAIASVDYALTENVENLRLTGSAIRATGNVLNNVLIGNEENNILDGESGADAMSGGAGDDAYIVDNAGDVVSEQAGDGTDTVRSSVSYSLSANVENLTLTGTAKLTATGNELGNVLVANIGGSSLFSMSGDDVLMGEAGDDHLDGGEGGDRMQGGGGNDTYVVDSANDLVTEFFNGGTDTVISSIDYVLPENVERLTLTGFGVHATGNELDNSLVGNDLGNFLDGRGGADEMRGGAGSDVYIVDNVGDLVVEAVSEGSDAVRSSIDYTLTANVETLHLTGDATRGTGNGLDNFLEGNERDNALDGDVGADVMAGGAGDDTYIVDDNADIVFEYAGQGVDTVQSSVSYGLRAHVENMTLTGSADLTATGNDMENVLIANSGNSTLVGLAGNDMLVGADGNDHLLGGDGDDVLSGGGGNDAYHYAEGGDLDLVVDTGGTDTLHFGAGLTLDRLALRVVEVDGRMLAQIRVLSDIGDEQPDQGIDFLVAATPDGRFVTPIERFILDSDQQFTFDDLLIKQTTLRGTNKADVLNGDRHDNTVYGNNQNDLISGGTGHDILYGENGDDVLHGGGGGDHLYGANGRDVLYGDGGDDLLDGGNGEDILIDTFGSNAFYGGNGADYIVAGVGHDLINADGEKDNGEDIVQAGAGNDVILSGNGNDLVDAGSGGDVIHAGNGDDWIAGGKGSDIIDGGDGKNVIAFVRGDGADVITNSYSGNDVVSLGAIQYADMKLLKAGNDLTLAFGSGDSITLSDWYASKKNQGIGKLQVITASTDYDSSSKDKTKNGLVGVFDFGKIVQHFDAARSADSIHEAGWEVMNGLLDAHLVGSQTHAIGGDLSFEYANNGTLAGIGLGSAQNSLNNISGMQALKARDQLEQGLVRMV